MAASVQTPFHESWDQKLVVAKAGKRADFKIVCPEQRNPMERTVSLNWPDNLKTQKLWCSLKIFERPFELEGRRWSSRTDKNEL